MTALLGVKDVLALLLTTVLLNTSRRIATQHRRVDATSSVSPRTSRKPEARAIWLNGTNQIKQPV